MRENQYLYKIVINDNYQKKKRNEVKISTHSTESAITTHI